MNNDKEFIKTKKYMEKLLGFDMLGYTTKEILDEKGEINIVYKFMDTIEENGFIIPKYLRADYNDNIEEELIEKRKRKEYRCLDGHKVRSQAELDIDNILYNSLITHAYEKEVIEISQRKVLSDWYIPVLHNEGIYIEYWGLNSQTYIKNKEEKINLYKQNNLNLIQIQLDEIKDKTNLTNRLLREIKIIKEKIKENL